MGEGHKQPPLHLQPVVLYSFPYNSLCASVQRPIVWLTLMFPKHPLFSTHVPSNLVLPLGTCYLPLSVWSLVGQLPCIYIFMHFLLPDGFDL
jgi:hypothetical protein